MNSIYITNFDSINYTNNDIGSNIIIKNNKYYFEEIIKKSLWFKLEGNIENLYDDISKKYIDSNYNKRIYDFWKKLNYLDIYDLSKEINIEHIDYIYNLIFNVSNENYNISNLKLNKESLLNITNLNIYVSKNINKTNAKIIFDSLLKYTEYNINNIFIYDNYKNRVYHKLFEYIGFEDSTLKILNKFYKTIINLFSSKKVKDKISIDIINKFIVNIIQFSLNKKDETRIMIKKIILIYIKNTLSKKNKFILADMIIELNLQNSIEYAEYINNILSYFI